MKAHLDMKKIAKTLGAERKGRVRATGGYFGALQVVADVKTRLRVPPGGGRATDSGWTERRLVALAPQTLARLERLSTTVREQGGGNVSPMQLAALLLERATDQLSATMTDS